METRPWRVPKCRQISASTGSEGAKAACPPSVATAMSPRSLRARPATPKPVPAPNTTIGQSAAPRSFGPRGLRASDENSGQARSEERRVGKECRCRESVHYGKEEVGKAETGEWIWISRGGV